MSEVHNRGKGRWTPDVYPMNTLGERIKSARGGMSQEAFSRELGISKGSLGFYERNENLPNTDVVLKICSKTGVSLEWLLTGEGPMHVRTDAGSEAADAVDETAEGACLRCVRLEDRLDRLEEERRELSDDYGRKTPDCVSAVPVLKNGRSRGAVHYIFSALCRACALVMKRRIPSPFRETRSASFALGGPAFQRFNAGSPVCSSESFRGAETRGTCSSVFRNMAAGGFRAPFLVRKSGSPMVRFRMHPHLRAAYAAPDGVSLPGRIMGEPSFVGDLFPA